jgi:hypothetical protein
MSSPSAYPRHDSLHHKTMTKRGLDAPEHNHHAGGETDDIPRFKQQVIRRGDGEELQRREPSSIAVAACLVDATPVGAITSQSVSDGEVLHLQTERLEAELELERQRVANL